MLLNGVNCPPKKSHICPYLRLSRMLHSKLIETNDPINQLMDLRD